MTLSTNHIWYRSQLIRLNNTVWPRVVFTRYSICTAYKRIVAFMTCLTLFPFWINPTFIIIEVHVSTVASASSLKPCKLVVITLQLTSREKVHRYATYAKWPSAKLRPMWLSMAMSIMRVHDDRRSPRIWWIVRYSYIIMFIWTKHDLYIPVNWCKD
jgi:hypothetical protein